MSFYYLIVPMEYKDSIAFTIPGCPGPVIPDGGASVCSPQVALVKEFITMTYLTGVPWCDACWYCFPVLMMSEAHDPQ